MKLQRAYFTMALESGIEWPSKEQSVQFRGRTITLRPETEHNAPSLVLKLDDTLMEAEARQLLQEFLSDLAWIRRRGMAETFSVVSTAGPMNLGKSKGGVRNDAPIEHLPDPTDAKARLALALYREAMALNVIPYKFLGFYKIINVLHDKGPAQKQWINGAISSVKELQALARLRELTTKEPDIGRYLYQSGRCAVAHAYGDPVVNPDNPVDVGRLALDLPLIRALAEIAVEQELGVQSYATIRSEHLYELEGFREIFGADVVRRLKEGEKVQPADVQVPERLSLCLQGRDQIASFENMKAQSVVYERGIVGLRLESERGGLSAEVHLCFAEERLVFDAIHFLVVADDGSVEAAECIRDAHVFFKSWLPNGVTEVWDRSKQRRLGRSEPVMPVNMRPDREAMAQAIREAEELISDRLKRSQSTGPANNPSAPAAEEPT